MMGQGVLAGGQKVKVVIAAAMWQNPHLLVLDEPTNYLDRESLGALASAIREYGGGVVMISHSSGACRTPSPLHPAVFSAHCYCGCSTMQSVRQHHAHSRHLLSTMTQRFVTAI